MYIIHYKIIIEINGAFIELLYQTCSLDYSRGAYMIFFYVKKTDENTLQVSRSLENFCAEMYRARVALYS